MTTSPPWYDVDFDRVLIEQSIAKQYGVLPSRQGELKYSDWSKLVSGLMPDTPLGEVVRIRSEKDKNVLKQFGPDQKRIRSDWMKFEAKRIKKANPAVKAEQIAELEKMLSALFER